MLAAPASVQRVAEMHPGLARRNPRGTSNLYTLLQRRGTLEAWGARGVS